MKKFKGLFLGLTLLFAIGMLTACGKVPEPTERDVLKGLEKEGYISETQVDEDVFSVQMKEVEIDDDKEGATVECVLSSDQEYVRVNTEYKIKFKIRDDKESWKVRKVTQNETTYELINSISDTDLENRLYWESIEIDGVYIYFYNDSTTYTVVDHEINAEAMTDVVTLEVTGSSSYKEVKATVKYTLRYDYSYGSWYTDAVEIVDTETSYVEGYEITLAEDRVIEDIIDEKDYVYMLGCYYYIDSDEITISNVRIGENQYNDSYMNVPVTITVSYEDVSFDVTYDLQYYFDSYDMEWEIYWLQITAYENFNSNFVGVWTGTSEDGQVTLTINDFFHEDYTDYLDVVVEITTDDGQTYSFSAYVNSYNPETGYIYIYDYDWIEEPTESYYREDFYGYIDETTFESDDYWYDFTLTKSN